MSTDRQAESGLSLDAQQERIEQWVAMHGAELVEVVIDAGESAKTLERPGLARALAMLTTGEADTLLVAKLDRLTRSVRDLDTLVSAHFDDGGADLVSVAESLDTHSASGRFMLNMLASISQWEREAIGERTLAAMSVKADRGERVGSIPYGYSLASDGVHLLPDDEEQATIQAARELRAGRLSLRAIAVELSTLGRRSRNGRTFAPTQVRRMLDPHAEAVSGNARTPSTISMTSVESRAQIWAARPTKSARVHSRPTTIGSRASPRRP